jgi:hypothetical protein
MGKAPETTISLSRAFALMFSTRGSWLDYFKYAVRYSRHGWVTVGGRRTFYRPTDSIASVLRDYVDGGSSPGDCRRVHPRAPGCSLRVRHQSVITRIQNARCLVTFPRLRRSRLMTSSATRSLSGRCHVGSLRGSDARSNVRSRTATGKSLSSHAAAQHPTGRCARADKPSTARSVHRGSLNSSICCARVAATLSS